jgi:hypothetical protein
MRSFGQKFPMELADFLSLHALLAVFGWVVATGMVIRHLHLIEANRLLTIGLICLCIVGIAGSWVEGAREHADSRALLNGLDKVDKLLSAPAQTPDQILAAAAAKLIQQDDKIKGLQSEIDQIKHPPPNPDGIFQGAMVGLANTVTAIPDQPEFVRFGEITHAQSLNTALPFQYKDKQYRVVQFGSRFGSASRPEDGTIYTAVIAREIR